MVKIQTTNGNNFKTDYPDILDSKMFGMRFKQEPEKGKEFDNGSQVNPNLDGYLEEKGLIGKFANLQTTVTLDKDLQEEMIKRIEEINPKTYDPFEPKKQQEQQFKARTSTFEKNCLSRPSFLSSLSEEKMEKMENDKNEAVIHGLSHHTSTNIQACEAVQFSKENIEKFEPDLKNSIDDQQRNKTYQIKVSLHEKKEQDSPVIHQNKAYTDSPVFLAFFGKDSSKSFNDFIYKGILIGLKITKVLLQWRHHILIFGATGEFKKRKKSLLWQDQYDLLFL
ncbi:hypothetical protein BLA29_006888 [Euroglyphus maynei]|uniref:Uncharacterized protein n=1 Tax=Euroglyphus maynei TaxID=6958 RepID=A0A1Y3BEF4_EURMA|nr:hypothetical protein BLA29_006888 [Euroglyphus maynei]